MPTERELAEAFTKILDGITDFGLMEMERFVMTAIKVAHHRLETEHPHMLVTETFTWSSKLKPEPKKKKAVTPTLF